MDRRSFLKTSSIATASLGIAGAASAELQNVMVRSGGRGFESLPLQMAPPIGWWDGSFEEQLDQAKEWGFRLVEWLGPEGDDKQMKAALDARGMAFTCIVGAGIIGPGTMVNPADHDQVEQQFRNNVKRAKTLGVTRLVGLTGNEDETRSREEQTDAVVTCLKRLAPIAEDNEVVLVLESLNTLVDHGGYFLTRTDQTMAILEQVDSPNVKMLFDIYHQQIMEGNVIRNLTNNIQRIGHFHVGDNPGRNEPGSGELNYRNIFKAIHDTGYDGYVALECGHTGTVDEALEATLRCFDWA